MNDVQKRAVAKGVDLDALPVHVAVIMDGNGRWARRQGLQRLFGHRQGYKALRSVLLNAHDLGVRYLTAYAFSAENWRRPEDEVAGLMALMERAARDELRSLHRNNVRLVLSGRIEELPETLQRALSDCVETTAGNTGITLNLAVNYGGRTEIVDAVKRIVREGVPVEKIDESTIAARLYQPSIPEPDMMIRTAGEMRWSNFLIWQSAYCELVVTDRTWPEFGPDDLVQAVLEYQSRTRKFGAVVE
ncbi:MAG: polyprenyl diphosphate synthase [Fimbriimonadaceae bacterium]